MLQVSGGFELSGVDCVIDLRGWPFITCEEGVAILLGVIFRQRSITWGVILINVMKVGQSSNKHDMKLNITAINSKHPL